MLHSIDTFQNGNISLDNLTKVNYIVSPEPQDAHKVLESIAKRQKHGAYWVEQEEFGELIEHKRSFPNSVQCLLISAPELNLYPDRQRDLATLLGKISKQTKLQLFVATNSPFIIGASATLTEQEFQDCDCPKDNFWPSQKVYYIKKGQTASRRGLITLDMKNKPKGRFGYWGKKAGFVASQMLGSGLSLEESSSHTPDSPILILCEGQNSEADALIYNQIFDTYEQVSGRSAMFISCLGSSQLSVSFDLMNQVKRNLSANFELLMLRDRDHEFASEDIMSRYKQSFPQRRILRRRAIEAYVYNSETADLVLQYFDKPPLIPIRKNRMDQLQARIQYEAESGYLGNDYKLRLKTMFRSLIGNLEYQWEDKAHSDPKYKFSVHVIAKLINPQTQTYKELARDIFEI